MTFVLDTARQSFELLMSVGAGTGLIYLLRWYWWRINAWSEVAAMISSFIVSVGFFIASKQGAGFPAHQVLLTTVGVTTVVWIATTFLTKPTDPERLRSFYSLVRPPGPGWNTVRAETGLPASSDSIAQMLLGWVLGVSFVYAALFGTGIFLYGQMLQAAVFAVVFAVSAVLLARLLSRIWSETPAGGEVTGAPHGR